MSKPKSGKQETEDWLRKHQSELEAYEVPLRESLLGQNFNAARAAVDANVGRESYRPYRDRGAEGAVPIQPPTDPTIESMIRDFQCAVLAESRLSSIQAKAITLRAAGMTQVEIAGRLKRTQQAISKALRSAERKIAAIRERLGGLHPNIEHQARHWWHSRQA